MLTQGKKFSGSLNLFLAFIDKKFVTIKVAAIFMQSLLLSL